MLYSLPPMWRNWEAWWRQLVLKPSTATTATSIWSLAVFQMSEPAETPKESNTMVCPPVVFANVMLLSHQCPSHLWMHCLFFHSINSLSHYTSLHHIHQPGKFLILAYLTTTSRQWLLNYCPLCGTAAYAAISHGWTYNILLSGSRQPTENKNHLVSNICYSLLFSCSKKAITDWNSILSACTQKRSSISSQEVLFSFYCTYSCFISMVSVLMFNLQNHCCLSMTSSSLHSCSDEVFFDFYIITMYPLISDVVFVNMAQGQEQGQQQLLLLLLLLWPEWGFIWLWFCLWLWEFRWCITPFHPPLCK
jgi:hypothetical protein